MKLGIGIEIGIENTFDYQSEPDFDRGVSVHKT